MKNVINFPPLSEEIVVQAALERLKKEKEDFESFKGTKAFYKLLGIYKPKKDEQVEHSFTSNNNLGDKGAFFADGIAEDVYKTLCNFVEKNAYFAAVVLKSKGNFTGCLAYAIHDFISETDKKKSNCTKFVSKSDFYVYSKAVEFYFSGASIEVEMKIVKPEGFINVPITAQDINEQSEYKAACDDAQAELIAVEKKKAEKKKQAEEKAKAKAEREAKKKAAEERKKKAEEFKKSQQSLFGDSENTDSVSKNKPSVPTPKPIVVKASKEKEKTDEQNESIQLSLW